MKAGSYNNESQVHENNVYDINGNPIQQQPIKKEWRWDQISIFMACLFAAGWVGFMWNENSGRHDFDNLEQHLKNQAIQYDGYASDAEAKKKPDLFQYWHYQAELKRSEADRVHEMKFCENANYLKTSCPNLWNGTQAQNIPVGESRR